MDDKQLVIHALLLKAIRQVLLDYPETISMSESWANHRAGEVRARAALNIGLIIGLIGSAGFASTDLLLRIRNHLLDGRCVPYEDLRRLEALIAANDI
jgi:hypothetical protein